MAPTGAAANVLGRGTGTVHATLKLPFTIKKENPMKDYQTPNYRIY